MFWSIASEMLLVPLLVVSGCLLLLISARPLKKRLKRQVKRSDQKLGALIGLRRGLQRVAKEDRAVLDTLSSRDGVSQTHINRARIRAEKSDSLLQKTTQRELSSRVRHELLLLAYRIMVVVSWFATILMSLFSVQAIVLLLASLGASVALLSVVSIISSNGYNGVVGQPATEQVSTQSDSSERKGSTDGSLLELPENERERIIAVAEAFVKLQPDATKHGLASFLGNFGKESGIQFKRAESDFTAPPLGLTSESDWDDDAWLDLGVPGSGNPRGIGIAQWSFERNTMLREFAKKEGLKWYDGIAQIRFMFEADNPSDIAIAKNILVSTDYNKGVESFYLDWERASAIYGDFPARKEWASKVYKILEEEGIGK